MRQMLALLLLCAPASLVGQKFATGLDFVDPTVYEGLPLASTPLMGTLPASADLSTYFPTPGDQGKQASCVGWAVAYALKSYQEKRERGWPLTSRSSQFSPAFIYNQIRRSSDCYGGTSYVDALNLLRRDGVAPLSDFPYSESTCNAFPDAAIKQRARGFAIAEWRRVNTQDEVEVKTNIASGFPVLIAMHVDLPFMQLRPGAIYSQYSGLSVGGHAMVAVGYDDERRAFKLINSWGQSWADGGFGWVSYNAFRQAVREGYVAQDIILQPPAPQPSPDPAPAPVPRPQPRPQPQPQPQPQPPRLPSANLFALEITHNVPVAHQGGRVGGPGMVLRAIGTISDASGRTAQLVVRFSFQNGQNLIANPQENSYRDVMGLVATGTQPFSVVASNMSTNGITMSLPYYTLNLQPTNGFNTYYLNATAFLYLDNFIIAQTLPTPFTLRW